MKYARYYNIMLSFIVNTCWERDTKFPTMTFWDTDSLFWVIPAPPACDIIKTLKVTLPIGIQCGTMLIKRLNELLIRFDELLVWYWVSIMIYWFHYWSWRWYGFYKILKWFNEKLCYLIKWWFISIVLQCFKLCFRPSIEF